MPDVAHERRKSTRRSQGAAFAIRVRKSSALHAGISGGCRIFTPSSSQGFIQ
jgi:hypothetical protein